MTEHVIEFAEYPWRDRVRYADEVVPTAYTQARHVARALLRELQVAMPSVAVWLDGRRVMLHRGRPPVAKVDEATPTE